ncbi:MAG: phenylacetate-CoA ligase [Epulopiscium sp.]|uniref:Phenylacetate-coenzyme A ligase n=1 Tax=Defluviitalea raffinosedens TaxID=1450156 RepID=A0A7C8HFG7_9FIRM|nr:phenylacetate--CoA ligase [Defluviitalea raffinosedens]MBZ4667757.1 Phenylacetate--CoA ligase [Defluviitaleaceae bacterium]MDK2787724.1 phenylacetate-CoA ligase [Candidatus Epulonipiscium sp.]KAE9636054.1 AMP-binding protein [Defluviitalea raffinosedens]MBM7685103.1 phenylacetate-CoA ligase [Defluviitalea raffinosedens]HHW67433.1 phenylacetate--CoA ligase [Candidatus Epulonipiscium sp.]
MIWNEHIECMGREEMRELQGKRLRETVERVYYNVPFYRKKMQELGLEPGDIRGIEDLEKLPFTTKQDLRDNYPYDLFAVPMSEVVRVHASSGTTGRPTVVGYTRKDLNTWSEVVARCLYAAGVRKNDIIQIAYGYGLFTGGLGLHYGSEKVGATVIPISGGNTQKQIQLMKDFGSTVLACTPSYALYLAEAMEEMGVDPKELSLRVGIFGAEPWTEEMRKEIESKLHLQAIDIFGLSEIIGPGVSCECQMQNGLHINEDHFIPETVDPKTLKPVPKGEIGELVFTAVTKEALPLLRYRTRDLTALHEEKCECGRTLIRMEKCKGRSDDMLIIRGVNVFPSQIESVLLNMGETKPHYLLIVDRVNNLDILEVWVEVEGSFFSDEIRKLEALTAKIKHQIESTLGISVKVKLVEPKTIERTEGKAKRVIDKRKI